MMAFCTSENLTSKLYSPSATISVLAEAVTHITPMQEAIHASFCCVTPLLVRQENHSAVNDIAAWVIKGIPRKASSEHQRRTAHGKASKSSVICMAQII